MSKFIKRKGTSLALDLRCSAGSSAGEGSDGGDACSCSKCQAVLGGTRASLRLIIATDSDWKRLFARLSCKQ